MASVTSTISNPTYSKRTRDSATASTLQTASSSATNVFHLSMDNTVNTANVHFKAYDSAAPSVGTTDPNLIVRLPASRRVELICKEGMTFSTALKFAVVTEAGTGGTTSPTTALDVSIGHS
ncbi:MAG: hypothetical protein D6681_20260 [Calditrichaeota bacterium]|nr:MAG: hypothetical protein D6681_20260 [Calditrichota bacterium]